MNPFKQIRKELGLSQEALANRLGVTRRTVYAWEAGESAPTVAMMAAEALKAEAEQPASWGIYRRAVKTSLGDMPEQLLAEYPTRAEAEKNLIELLRVSDIYTMRETAQTA